METRKTKQRYRTLEILADKKVSHGFEIASIAGLQVGTIYGILMGFDAEGIVESRWDESQPNGRPRKKLYRLTRKGIDLLAEYKDHFGAEQSLGLLDTINRDLHEAIDQVWGGLWQVSARVQRQQQDAANARARVKDRVSS